MRIGIVNDLALAVEVLRRLVHSVPDYEVAWTAGTGIEAAEKCARDCPDLILMDLIMPLMDGAQATRIIMKESPCAILVVTATVAGNADKVFAALSAGALDAVATPVFGPGGGINGGEELLRKIAVIGKLIALAGRGTPAAAPSKPQIAPVRPPRLVALGASTGGPNALAIILRSLPKNLEAALVVVQHLDAQFAPALVEWLGNQTDLPVSLIRENLAPEAGRVFVAGTNDHLVIDADLTFHYTAEPVDYPYRPSVDEFFLSLGRHWPQPGVACLLTGMGRDGAQGLLVLHRAGWKTIAQDEKTCVVYGMPRAAMEAGAVAQLLPVERISVAILDEVRKEKVA
ncbi:MAG: chemotaxis-specific protein-glutamate methyltransferase CheB [Acidobacteria bacterium]|nr:MAG: chemotaxis-specific protein-glutamate methyltransferase CheB [Acidobacteriota bacterium]